MNQTIIPIDIYCCKLTVIVTQDFKAIAKRYNLAEELDIENFGAFVFKDQTEYRSYVMVLEDGWRANVAHELVHVVNLIYLDCDMQLDRINDEPQAYLTGYLFDKIDEFLNKINK